MRVRLRRLDADPSRCRKVLCGVSRGVGLPRLVSVRGTYGLHVASNPASSSLRSRGQLLFLVDSRLTLRAFRDLPRILLHPSSTPCVRCSYVSLSDLYPPSLAVCVASPMPRILSISQRMLSPERVQPVPSWPCSAWVDAFGNPPRRQFLPSLAQGPVATAPQRYQSGRLARSSRVRLGLGLALRKSVSCGQPQYIIADYRTSRLRKGTRPVGVRQGEQQQRDHRSVVLW